TSLLQLLLLLKQTSESPDRTQVLNLGDDRALVDLGTFQDVVFSHDLSNPLRMQLGWTLPQPFAVPDPADPGVTLFQDGGLRFRTTIASQGTVTVWVEQLSLKWRTVSQVPTLECVQPRERRQSSSSSKPRVISTSCGRLGVRG